MTLLMASQLIALRIYSFVHFFPHAPQCNSHSNSIAYAHYWILSRVEASTHRDEQAGRVGRPVASRRVVSVNHSGRPSGQLALTQRPMQLGRALMMDTAANLWPVGRGLYAPPFVLPTPRPIAIYTSPPAIQKSSHTFPLTSFLFHCRLFLTAYLITVAVPDTPIIKNIIPGKDGFHLTLSDSKRLGLVYSSVCVLCPLGFHQQAGHSFAGPAREKPP